MPSKRSKSSHAPIHILEHLQWWGSEIRRQRIEQRLTAAELALRIGVSHPTIGRIEKGDGSVAVSSYMFVIYSLGLTDLLIPEPTDQQRAEQHTPGKRSRAKPDKLGEDLGYF